MTSNETTMFRFHEVLLVHIWIDDRPETEIRSEFVGEGGDGVDGLGRGCGWCSS